MNRRGKPAHDARRRGPSIRLPVPVDNLRSPRGLFKDHFSERAPGYARWRPRYPTALADWLAEAAPARGRAWDAGCGSGQLSVLLADRFGEVIATDASAAQLEHARPHPRVEYRVATAEASGLPSASVDLAGAAQAAHWFDLPRYWEEIRRVARPGAVVALATYGNAVVEPTIDERVGRFYRDDLGPYWTPERRLVENGYATVDFPFDELRAPSLTMSERWTGEQFVGYVGTWSAVQRLTRAGGAPRFEAFARELREAWGAEPRDVTWPLSLRVGRVAPRRRP